MSYQKPFFALKARGSSREQCLGRSTANTNGGWKDAAPAIALLAAGLLALLIATISPSGSNNRYTVIAPPWYTPGRTVSLIQAADGQIAGLAGRDHVMVAYSEDPAFVRDLYSAGAWLVIEPIGFAACAGADITSFKRSGTGSNA